MLIFRTCNREREIEAFLPEKETKSYENGMRQGGVL